MDPISIVSGVAAAIKSVYTVSAAVYSFIDSTKHVDKSLENLHAKIRALTRVLEDLKDFLEVSVVAQSSHVAASRSDGVWACLRYAVHDTQLALDSLHRQTKSFGDPSKTMNVFRKASTQIQRNVKSESTKEFQACIAWHKTCLQMALQTVELLVF